jgi:uroporphyrinogen decarboxylase
MSSLSKRERVDAALRGEAVDRVPVSAWRHFIPEERSPQTLAEVSLKHFTEFDWDWLKINPRATYYAEAWGNQYDYSHYDSVLPKLIDGPLHGPSDLKKIQPVAPTVGVFNEQLELVRLVKQGIGGAHFLLTVFSPLSVLAFLAAHPKNHSIGEATQAQVDGVRRLIEENPAGAHEALKSISKTLAQFSAAAVDAGASGLFFAIVKLARQDVLTEAEYETFGKPYDLAVLEAVQGASFNLLHICGPRVYFNSILNYPVHAVNWASIDQDNPDLVEARRLTGKAVVGGVDETGVLQHGTPDQVIQQASASIRATKGLHHLLTPGCATNPDVPAANLHALRKAAELI